MHGDSSPTTASERQSIHKVGLNGNVGGCSVWKTVMNLLIVGAGFRMVWISRVLSSLGWLFGFALLLAIGTLSAYLVICMYEAYAKSRLKGHSFVPSYCGLIDHVLGRKCMYIAWVALNLTMVGFQASGIVLATAQIKELVDTSLDKRSICLIVSAIYSLLSLVNSPSFLAYISLFGLLGSIILAFTILSAGIIKINQDGVAQTSLASSNLTDILMAASHAVMSFNMVFATVPQIGGMKDFRKFPRAASLTFSGLGLLYLIIATVCYCGWGSILASKSTPVDVLANGNATISMMIALAIEIFSVAQYAGLFYAIGISTDSLSKKPIIRISLRLGLHAIQSALAYFAIRDIRIIIDIVAVSFVPLLAIILPALLHCKSSRLLETRRYFELAFFSLVITAAAAVTALGLPRAVSSAFSPA